LSKSFDQKIFAYITALEKSNYELVKTLKKCVRIMTELTTSVLKIPKWQEMLEGFEETIKIAESTVNKKTLY